MESQRQLAANRKNALSSSGPRTVEGKAAASLNAVKHGLRSQHALLPNEDPEAFAEFRQAVLQELEPVGALESAYAARIADLTWRAQRSTTFEAGLFSSVRNVILSEEARRRVQRQVHPTPLAQELGLEEIVDPEAHAAAIQEAEEYEDEQVSELPLTGATFERANAFSTLLRYETTLDRMRRKLLNDLKALQSRRQRRSRDRVRSANLATEERTNEDDATATIKIQ